MVAEQVRPPELDILNEALVRSHLHAVWLAEARLALSPDIPKSLDLQTSEYPLNADILDRIHAPDLQKAAQPAMRRVLEQVRKSLPADPFWLDDPDAFIAEVAAKAPQELGEAFKRWRQLYSAARRQLSEANTR